MGYHHDADQASDHDHSGEFRSSYYGTEHPDAGATVSVRGHATLEVEPDWAKVSITLEAHHVDRATAVSDVAVLAEALREVLDHVDGVVEVLLPRASVARTQQQVDGEWVHTGYSATVSGTAKCDTDAAGRAVRAISECGSYARYVSWGLDDDNPAHRQVRINAVGEARAAAEDFAAAVGRPLGGLVTLADPGLLGAGTQSGRQYEGASMAYAVGSAGGWEPEPVELDLDPEAQTVSATVEACYRLG